MNGDDGAGDDGGGGDDDDDKSDNPIIGFIYDSYINNDYDGNADI